MHVYGHASCTCLVVGEEGLEGAQERVQRKQRDARQREAHHSARLEAIGRVELRQIWAPSVRFHQWGPVGGVPSAGPPALKAVLNDSVQPIVGLHAPTVQRALEKTATRMPMKPDTIDVTGQRQAERRTLHSGIPSGGPGRAPMGWSGMGCVHGVSRAPYLGQWGSMGRDPDGSYGVPAPTRKETPESPPIDHPHSPPSLAPHAMSLRRWRERVSTTRETTPRDKASQSWP